MKCLQHEYWMNKKDNNPLGDDIITVTFESSERRRY